MSKSSVSLTCAAMLMVMAFVVAGCQNQPSDRQARLYVDENRKLKIDLSKLNAKCETLTSELENCTSEKGKIQKEAEDTVNFVMTKVTEEGKKEQEALIKENQQLKAELEKLKAPQSK